MTTMTLSNWRRFAAPIAAIWYGFGLSQAVLAYRADAAAAPLPIWLAYAAACLLGLAGSAALILAPARAAACFALSLAMAVIYFGWLFAFGQPLAQDYGIGAMVVAVTAVLWVASRRR